MRPSIRGGGRRAKRSLHANSAARVPKNSELGGCSRFPSCADVTALLFIASSDWDALSAKGVTDMIAERSEGGFFDRVVSVHPLARRTRRIAIAPRHDLIGVRLRCAARRHCKPAVALRLCAALYRACRASASAGYRRGGDWYRARKRSVLGRGLRLDGDARHPRTLLRVDSCGLGRAARPRSGCGCAEAIRFAAPRKGARAYFCSGARSECCASVDRCSNMRCVQARVQKACVSSRTASISRCSASHPRCPTSLACHPAESSWFSPGACRARITSMTSPPWPGHSRSADVDAGCAGSTRVGRAGQS